jgi:hypothetical protein
MDEASRNEIEKLANEYEAVVAFYKLGQAKIAAADVHDESHGSCSKPFIGASRERVSPRSTL